MVAAEAAACGCPPLVARHSGLAEVAEGLEAEYPRAAAASLRSRRETRASCGRRLADLLTLTDDDRDALRAAARRAAVERWSWTVISERLLAPV